ncbi:MAG: NAD(P)/FAD-dependent oxidoreductase [Fimbriimonadaceae bacterium]
MRVAVIGAGLAGLASARTLAKNSVDVVVFEKAGYVGGRCATRKIGDFVFDSGATSLAPRGRALEQVMLTELPTEQLRAVEPPIDVHDGARILPGDPRHNALVRYTYVSGNNHLPQMLAEGIEVRTRQYVDDVDPKGETFHVMGEEFDAVIATEPLPQVLSLIDDETLRTMLSRATYRPCLSILLGFDTGREAWPFHALIEPSQTHPLTWLSIESAKCEDRAPAGGTAMVAQLSPRYSRTRFDEEDSVIIDDTLHAIRRLLGEDFGAPVVGVVKRWMFSQPEVTVVFEQVNLPGSRLLFAGDGLLGGRAELAYETGLRAAGLLLVQE